MGYSPPIENPGTARALLDRERVSEVDGGQGDEIGRDGRRGRRGRLRDEGCQEQWYGRR